MARRDKQRLNGKGSVPQKNKAMPGGINRKERQRLRSSRFGKQERNEARRRGQEMHRQQMEIANARKQKWIDHQRGKKSSASTPDRVVESYALQRYTGSPSHATAQVVGDPFRQIPFDRKTDEVRVPRTTERETPTPRLPTEERTAQPTPLRTTRTKREPKEKRAFTSAQRMRRLYERMNPLSSRKNQKEIRRELGKNIGILKNEDRTEVIGDKFNHLGTYNILSSAPARKAWYEMNTKQQERYEKQVMGIIDQYLTSRKVMEFTPFETITGDTDFRTQSRLIDEYAQRNPKSKIINETEKNSAAFARTLTKKEKQSRLDGERKVFLKGSILDAQRNRDRLMSEIQRLDKRKDGAKRAGVLRKRLSLLINRITILSGIQSNISAREAGEKEWIVSKLFPRPSGPQPRPVRKGREEQLSDLRTAQEPTRRTQPPQTPGATEPNPFAHMRRPQEPPQVIRMSTKPGPGIETSPFGRTTTAEERRLHQQEMERRYAIADRVREIKRRNPMREKIWPRDENDLRRQAIRELAGLPPEPTAIKRWMQAGKNALKRIRFRRRQQ